VLLDPASAPIQDASWVLLGGRFCFEFGAGTLAALAFVPPAPVGPPFYRLLAAHASVPILLGTWLLSAAGALSIPVACCAAITVVALPCFALPTKGKLRWFALGAAVVGSGLAVILGTAELFQYGWLVASLATLSALGSGLLVGGIGVAMALGHAYLTYPNLKISHLARVHHLTIAILVAKAALLVATLLLIGGSFEPLQRALGSMGGMFGLFTRAAVGLFVPFVFALMVSSSLRYQNTRSATGILYASTVLVLIGEAVAMSLRGQAAGLPL